MDRNDVIVEQAAVLSAAIIQTRAYTSAQAAVDVYVEILQELSRRYDEVWNAVTGSGD